MTEAPLSIVIPALDAAATLPACLASLEEARACGLLGEVIVSEGGNCGATCGLAEAWGARVIVVSPGRGQQLRDGARTSTGRWLLFLHADTVLQRGWAAEVAGFIAASDNAARAAVFPLVLDDPAPQARRVERLANWRSRRLALPYGDQGLLISRDLYDALGGYRPLSLMEDVDLVRRLVRRRGRASLTILKSAAVTSAVRYRRGGWLLRPLRNLSILALYFAGAPPRLLQRLYG